MDDSRYPAFQLGKVLKTIKWPTEETYVTNLIKCSLLDNRKPTEQDLNTCFKLYFLQELMYIMPRVIICLGDIVYSTLNEKLESKYFPMEKVFHHSYIHRNQDKFSEWKGQWEKIVVKYNVQ